MPLFRRAPPTLDPQRAYALWADTYPPSAHNPLMRAEQAAMESFLESLPLPRTVRALDVGTGSGRYLEVLAQRGVRRVVGLDLSWAMLTHNRSGFPLVRADAETLPFASATFDLVSASLMVGDVPLLDRWMHEIARVLRPGGHVLYSDLHPSWAGRKWQRTFETGDGRSFAIRHCARSISEHHAALSRAGMTTLETRELHLDDECAAEVQAFRQRWGDVPVAVVFHALRLTGLTGSR